MQSNRSIEEVAKEILVCRAQKKRAYPEALWGEIARLCEQHPLPEISRRIGISAHYLEKRIGRRPAQFCELPVVSPFQASAVSHEILIRRGDGSELAVRMPGAVDIVEVIAGFMRS